MFYSEVENIFRQTAQLIHRKKEIQLEEILSPGPGPGPDIRKQNQNINM